MDTINLTTLESSPVRYNLYSKAKDDPQDPDAFRALCVAHFERKFGYSPERCEVWHGTGLYLGPIKEVGSDRSPFTLA